MKTKTCYFPLKLITLCILVVSGCTRLSSNGSVAAAGPVSWIDKPLTGFSFPVGPIEIITHSNDPSGVSQVEMSANGTIFATLPASETMVKSTQTWTPTEPGNYILRVRAQGKGGAWGDYAEVTITVGEATQTYTPTPAGPPVCSNPTPVCASPTPTLAGMKPSPTPVGFVPKPLPVCSVSTSPLSDMIPTPTLIEPFTPTPVCISPTPTLAGLKPSPTPLGFIFKPLPVCPGSSPTPLCASPTPVITFTPTKTLTSAPAAMSFSPTVSTTQFYYGGCNPDRVTVQVQVSNPDAVSSVVLFQMLDGQTGWDGGTAMPPSGGGKYALTVTGNSVPGHTAATWVYQFVATDRSGQVIGRSQRYYDVTLAACGAPPPPVRVITVTPIKVKPLPIPVKP